MLSVGASGVGKTGYNEKIKHALSYVFSGTFYLSLSITALFFRVSLNADRARSLVWLSRRNVRPPPVPR